MGLYYCECSKVKGTVLGMTGCRHPKYVGGQEDTLEIEITNNMLKANVGKGCEQQYVDKSVGQDVFKARKATNK